MIGIGNPLRGDDGVGAALLEELAGERGGWSGPEAELKAVHQLTPELALAVAGARRVLFVDAWANPATTEPWLEPLALDTRNGNAPAPGGVGGHGLAPPVLVALAEALYGWRGEAALLRVPAFAFPHGPGLSAPLEAGLPLARQLVRRWLGEG